MDSFNSEVKTEPHIALSFRNTMNIHWSFHSESGLRGKWWYVWRERRVEYSIRIKNKTNICWINFVDDIMHSVQFSRSVVANSLQHHGLQHARPPCPSPTAGVYSNSSPSSRWCHPTISTSVIPFSPHLESYPASGSFQMSQFFTSGGQSIGVSASASVLPMNIQDWFPLGWTCWISMLPKGLSRVFSNTTVQKYQFFSAQLSL